MATMTPTHVFFSEETGERVGEKRYRSEEVRTFRGQQKAPRISIAEQDTPLLKHGPALPLAPPPSAQPISIAWPPVLPVPSIKQETTIIPVLLPGPQWRWRQDSYESPRYSELPLHRQRDIAAAARRCGMHLEQACSLRRQVLGSAAPWKLQGSEAVELELATQLEEDVARFLTARGAVFLTQDGIKAEALARGDSLTGLATPDFLLRSKLIVNGRAVHWIEVKRFYGAGVSDLRQWQPSIKAPKQFDRYRTLHGPGAAVLMLGHASGFRRRVHADVQLLDAEIFRYDAGNGGTADARDSPLSVVVHSSST